MLVDIKLVLEITLLILQIVILVKDNFKPKNNKKNRRSSDKS